MCTGQVLDLTITSMFPLQPGFMSYMTWDDSHDEDGRGDERGGVESPLTVEVFPLPLVHLPPTVLAAAAHAEAHSNDGGEDHEGDAQGGAYEESCFVVDPLQERRDAGRLSFLVKRFQTVKFHCAVTRRLPVVAGPRSLAASHVIEIHR